MIFERVLAIFFYIIVVDYVISLVFMFMGLASRQFVLYGVFMASSFFIFITTLKEATSLPCYSHSGLSFSFWKSGVGGDSN